MKKLFGHLILITVMTLTSLNASADKYERAWKLVDKDIEQDLPESAAEKVNGIFDMAAGDRDSKQMLKSAVYMAQIETMLVGDNLESTIDLFNNLLPNLRQSEYKAICHAFLAKSYMQYWKRHRYTLQRNLPQDTHNVPLDRMTASQICDTIMNHLQLSLDMAGEARSQWFEDFFPGGNSQGMRLRPALVDLLLDNAVTEISGQRLNKGQRRLLEDSRLYGTAQQFVEATAGISQNDPDLWQLYVLNRMSARNFESKPDIRSTVDSRRMEVLADMLDDCSQKWTETDSIWVAGMLQLGETYGKKVSFASVFMSRAVRRIMARADIMTDEQEIRYTSMACDMCRRAMDLWPRSEGAFDCMGMLGEMEAKDVALTLQGDLMAGSSNIALFEYSNVGTVFFRAVEVAGELKDMNVPSILDQLARCNTASEWKNVMGAPKDHVRHLGLTRIPPLMQGSYYILASTGSNFGAKDVISFAYTECRALTFVPMETQKGNIEGFFVNTRTGQAVPEVKYTLWQTDYDDNMTKIAKYGFGDADGHVLIEGLKEGRYAFELTHGSDMGNCKVSVGYVRDMPQPGTVRLYVDRYTYRPGDSVQFAALFYNREGLNGGKVIAGAPVRVTLRNASSKEVGHMDLVTDSMGMAMGSLKIPAGSMPGRFSLRAVAGEEGETVSSWNGINVENFKQPKFTVRFDAFDEPHYFDREIHISGRVMTMTGQPVSGAQIQWSASLQSGDVNIFMPRTDNGRVRLTGGQDFTSADGSFSLSFTVPEDMTYGDGSPVPVFVPVQVTDLNGETRSADAYVMIGKGSRSIFKKISDDVVSEDGSMCLQVGLTDNGENVKGNIHVSVSPIEREAGSGLSLESDYSFISPSYNGRQRNELTESAAKQELSKHFPRYCLNFSSKVIYGTPILDRTVTVGQKEADVSLKIEKPGEYALCFESEQAEPLVEQLFFCPENDRSYVPDGSLMRVVNHSVKVNVGDTAVIRLGNRYPGSVILYSVLDRYGMNRYGQLVSDGTQMSLEIPVTTALEGGFTVHLFSMLDNVKAFGDVHFDVPYTSHSLLCNVETGSDKVSPGNEIKWNFRLQNPDGSPAKARLLLGMYDRALDVYGTNVWNLQPWSTFYPYVNGSYGNNSRYSATYNPAWYGDGKAKTYSGKVALTGVLLDPLSYIGMRKGLMLESTSGLQTRSALKMIGANASDGTYMSQVTEEESVSGSDSAQEEAQWAVDSDNLRTSFDPTGLFISMETDSEGNAGVSFPAPELLTGWHVQAIAWNDSLSVAKVNFDMTTAKELMIEPAAPRFVRQGDVLDFSFKIVNSTEDDMDVRTRIDLSGGLSSQSKTVHVPAGGSNMAVFTVKVPTDGLQVLEYTLSAASGNRQDAVRDILPVLSTRTMVTRSISLFNNGNETRSFRFEELAQPLSSQARDERMVLEYSSTPIWYAIQCLPTLMRTDDPSSLRLAHSIMGAASALEIMKRNPDVRDMVREWASQPAGELQSRLERNEDVTAVLTAETPWYMQAQNEKDRLRNLGLALDEEQVSEQLSVAVGKLLEMHVDGAGWPWMEGMSPDAHITISILECLGRLRENGALQFDGQMESAVSDALMWLDGYFAKDFESKDKPESVGALQLSYLLVLQRFADIVYFGSRNDVHKFYMNLAEKQDTRNLNLMERAQLALLLSAGHADRADHVVRTMLERSVLEDEMGRYWKDNKSGYRWQDAPIESQALAIEALLVTGHRQEAEECSRWLLKQRQTSDWGTSPATVHAVVALLAAGDGQVRLSSDITISVGRRGFRAADNSRYGYMKVEMPGRAPASAADVKVSSNNDGVSWGAVYYQYTDELENVAASSNGIVMERSLWRVESNADGDYLQDIAAGARLNVGDRIRVRLKVSVDRAMEYVQLRDMWAAGFEPVETRAGWHGAIFHSRSFYMAPGNSSMDFYFDRLSEGSFEIEYDMYVQKSGVFQAGRAVVQCLYSPDMRAGTSSQKIVVGK